MKSPSNFALEVFFRREPKSQDVEPLLGHIRQFVQAGSISRKEIGDLAILISSGGPPGQITPHQEPGEPSTPRLGMAFAVVGPAGPPRHIVVGVPFSDERADEFLKKEAAQLPKSHPGVIMVDVGGEPSFFTS